MQQVNLYLDEFKQIKPPYSALFNAALLTGIIILSIIISVVLYIGVWHQKSQLDFVQQDLNTWQQALEVAQKKYPDPLVDSALTQKITSLEKKSQRNEKLLRFLSTRNMDVKRQSFSKILSALTQIKQPGLWLTEINIAKGGATLSFSGFTQKASALPEYLKKLAKLSEFEDMHFKVFDMNRKGSNFAFMISSSREAKVEDLLESFSKKL